MSRYGLSPLTNFLVFDGVQHALYQQLCKSSVGCLPFSAFHLQITVISDTNPS